MNSFNEKADHYSRLSGNCAFSAQGELSGEEKYHGAAILQPASVAGRGWLWLTVAGHTMLGPAHHCPLGGF